jgi:uncharacterized iron-regulated membrane protein
MTPSTAALNPVSTSLDARSLYRAVWRWHFYAGLLVLPFLLWLAVTGALFVFNKDIDGFFHRELKTVPVANSTGHSHEAVLAAALAVHPGTVLKYTPAELPDSSAEVGVATAKGERLAVFVDPHTARVLGDLPDRGTVGWTIRKLHSLKYFSPIARGAIEVAAGWAILLVLTGIYLWWPRGRSGGVVSVRGQPRQRMFWRDLHAVTGLFVGSALLFLAFTGMPWSVFLGEKVNGWANGQNFGYPAGVRVAVPMSEQRLSDAGPTPWSLEQARLPQSAHAGHDEHEGHGVAAAPALAAPAQHALGLNAAIAIFERLGIAKGYTVNPPTGPTGVYTASVYPNALADQRVIHIDQYSGRPLVDMRYADYGWLGRWLEWGINVHLGQEFGVPNQIALVAACFGIALLCVSAAVMWWKRRPAGSLGVPPLPANPRAHYGVIGVLVIGGVAFPLVGASLLIMLTLDTLVVRSRQPARH